jgi:hypothetical protein
MNIRGAPDSSAADRAMYEAKRRGKGGFVIHAPLRGGCEPCPFDRGR